MHDGYFKRVMNLTPTRLWINNPTLEQASVAIDAGAVGCTTNPTYVSKLLETDDRIAVEGIIDRCIAATHDDATAAALVQRELVARLLPPFEPLHRLDPKRYGYVSLQGDPYAEEDPAHIIDEALRTVELGVNAIAKIPVTQAGIEAIGHLVAKNVPIIATEIMAVSQAIDVCETYRAASRKSGHAPAFFVTHITGIFDESLAVEAGRTGIELSPEALFQAGSIIVRRIARIMAERNYPGVLLGGGARGLHHFTEMVGGDMHVTINWPGAAATLIHRDPPVLDRFATPAAEQVLAELLSDAPRYAEAYAEDGLRASEYAEYPPVAFFREAFCRGWDSLIAAIRHRRETGNAPERRSVRRDNESKFTEAETSRPVEMLRGITRRTMSFNDGLMLCHFTMEKGARIPLHNHVAAQNGYVIRGCIELFDEAGSKRKARAGSGYVFDSMEKHGLVVLEDTELVEAFSPMRPEYADR